MRRKKHTPEEIDAKLRQVDVLVSPGVACLIAKRTPSSLGLDLSCGIDSSHF
jgi:hypothetical protein